MSVPATATATTTTTTTTALHLLCSSENVSFVDIQNEAQTNPSDVSKKDEYGRLPLHVLGENVPILEKYRDNNNNNKAKDLQKIINYIVSLCPQGITSEDDNKYIPFTSIIMQWYKNNNKFPTGRSTTKSTSTTSAAATATTTSISCSAIEACFEILSQTGYGERDDRDIIANYIVDMAPNILSSILLMKDGKRTNKGTGDRIMKLPILSRMMLCPNSVGMWLDQCLLVQDDDDSYPSERALDYLTFVSRLNVEDHWGGSQEAIKEQERDDFTYKLYALYGTFQRKHLMETSLITLSQDKMDRVTLLPIVWHVLDSYLLQPLPTAFVLIDFAFNVTLIGSARAVETTSTENDTYTRCRIASIYLILIHFLATQLFACVALWRRSKRACFRYCTDIWTLLDFITIVITFTSVDVLSPVYEGQATEVDHIHPFLVGLLWLRILSFLRLVNQHMGIFIISLVNIIKRLASFFVVFVVIILAFADIFQITFQDADDGQYCLSTANIEDNSAAADYCSDGFASAILRSYAVLLNDFDTNEYRINLVSTIFFVIYTLMGFVILMNVIIAVISAVYEQSEEESLIHFGKARMIHVCYTGSLEMSIRLGRNPIRAATFRSFCGRTFRIARFVAYRLLVTYVTVVEIMHVVHQKENMVYVVLTVLLSIVPLVIGLLLVVYTSVVSSLFSSSNWAKQRPEHMVLGRFFYGTTEVEVAEFVEQKRKAERSAKEMEELKSDLRKEILAKEESSAKEIEELKSDLRKGILAIQEQLEAMKNSIQ